MRCARFIGLTSFRLCSANTEGSSGLRLIRLLRAVGVGFRQFRVYLGFVGSSGTLGPLEKRRNPQRFCGGPCCKLVVV